MDVALAALAGEQLGVVSAAQLAALGFTPSAIARRLAAGRLHRLHRGVYAVGHMALTPKSHYLAAVLACGPGALASHRLAGAIWGLLQSATEFEVTAPRSRGRHEGILVHRSRLVAPDDRAIVDAIPVTSVARTLVDLADVLPDRRLADAVHRAEILRLFDLTSIQRTLDRLPGRTGRHKLRRVLATYEPKDENPLQQRFLDFCKEYDLPTPQAQAQIGPYTVDFLWPHANLAVETDGATTHQTRRAFYADRKRDRALAAAGIQVLRVTWPDFDDAAGLAGEIAAILARAA